MRLVVPGTGQRRHEEETGLIGLHLADQPANVTANAFLAVVGESDDIADDGCDPRVVPCLDGGTVILHPVLGLAHGL